MDWLAGLLELSGLWLVGRKLRWGFIANAIGCAIWISVSIRFHVWGLLVIAVPAFWLNLWNWLQWGRSTDSRTRHRNRRIR